MTRDGRTVQQSEVYGELIVPLLNDKPGFRQMNLELGYRYAQPKSEPRTSTRTRR